MKFCKMIINAIYLFKYKQGAGFLAIKGGKYVENYFDPYQLLACHQPHWLFCQVYFHFLSDRCTPQYNIFFSYVHSNLLQPLYLAKKFGRMLKTTLTLNRFWKAIIHRGNPDRYYACYEYIVGRGLFL